MAYTTIDKPTDYFNTVLYTGNGSTQSITGVGFQPDCTWTKGRTGTYGVSNHKIYDVIRGATKTLFINLTNAETTQTNTLTSFDSDGFSLGDDTNINASSTTFASWSWKANGAGVSNTNGSITSSVSANTTSGFSIVSYTGNNSLNQTVGHGLGVAPKVIFIKVRNNTADPTGFVVYHASNGANYSMTLYTTNAKVSNTTSFSNTSPTSTVFSVGDDGGNWGTNFSTYNFIAYCFAEKKGFSKFGSYTGNGSSSDGTFVYTGFRPAFILIKRTDAGTSNWFMYDTKRNTFNATGQYGNYLWSNSSQAEAVGGAVDFYSNGFKLFTSWSEMNASGGTYIYMAFAESPFTTSTGIPTTAR